MTEPLHVPYQPVEHDPANVIRAIVEIASIRFVDENGEPVEGPAELNTASLQLALAPTVSRTSLRLPTGENLPGVRKFTLTYEAGRPPMLDLSMTVFTPRKKVK